MMRDTWQSSILRSEKNKSRASNSTHQTAPGPRGYPIIGLLHKFMQDPLQFLVDVGDQYGDVVRMRLGPRLVHLLNHPNHIKYILQDNYSNYCKRFKNMKSVFGEGLGTTDGDFWRHQRRLSQPTSLSTRLQNLSAI